MTTSAPLHPSTPDLPVEMPTGPANGQRRPARSYVLETLAIFVVYSLLAEFNRFLTLPPIDIAPVWLPAGFAVGVILVRGWWTLLPLFLTGAIRTLITDWDLIGTAGSGGLSTPTVAWAAVVYGGAVAGHAAAAKPLVDRIPGDGTYDEARSATLLLVFAGPLSCIVSALLGTWAFHVEDLIPSGSFWISTFTFWIGDSIASILLVPVMLALTGGAAWRERRGTIIALATLTFTIVISTMWLVGRTELNRIHESYERASTRMARDLRAADPSSLQTSLDRLVAAGDDPRASAVLVQGAPGDHATIVAATPRSRARNTLVDRSGHLQEHGSSSSSTTFVVRRSTGTADDSRSLFITPSRGYLTERAFLAALVPASIIALVLALTTGVLALSSTGQRVRLERLVRRRTSELEASELRYRSVVDNVREGIFQLDRTHRLVFVNAAWHHLVEPRESSSPSDDDDASSEGSGTGMRLTEALQVTDEARLSALVEQARLTPGVVVHGEFESVDLDRVFEVRMSSRSVVDGEDAAIVGTIVDMTAQRGVFRNRERFVSLVAHELRNPLTVISGSVATITAHEQDALPPLATQLLPAVQTSADKLDRIIEDLLVASQVDAGTLSLHVEPTDLRALCRDAVASSVEAASSRGIELTADTDDTPVVVPCDADRISQVLDNLLSNAIKYTPARGRVRVAVTRSGDDATRVAVHDTGIGISEEDHDRVFERFGRTDAGARVAAGTGLGLAICLAIAQAHGGTIDVQSSRGSGSTFTLVLPSDDVSPTLAS